MGDLGGGTGGDADPISSSFKSVLFSLILNPEFLGPSRGAQNVCSVTKGGTVLKNYY